MSKKTIHVVEKVIKHTEYIIEVPVIDHRKLNAFLEENLSSMGDIDQWIVRHVLGFNPANASAFKVCFRSPNDFGLDKRIFFRVWDFNKELIGETLGPQQVLSLCWTISQLSKNHPLFLTCGSNFHVMSDVFEAGKYRDCLMRIGFNSQLEKPQVHIAHFSSPLSFDATGYYGVLVK